MLCRLTPQVVSVAFIQKSLVLYQSVHPPVCSTSMPPTNHSITQVPPLEPILSNQPQSSKSIPTSTNAINDNRTYHMRFSYLHENEPEDQTQVHDFHSYNSQLKRKDQVNPLLPDVPPALLTLETTSISLSKGHALLPSPPHSVTITITRLCMQNKHLLCT